MKSDIRGYDYTSCFMILFDQYAASSQYDQTKNQVSTNLQFLRKCPICGSINYIEEIITHNVQ
jgi:hypothetical protein